MSVLFATGKQKISMQPPFKCSRKISRQAKRLPFCNRRNKFIASAFGLERIAPDIFKNTFMISQKNSITLVVGAIGIYIPMAGMVDLANEKSRLEKELKDTELQIERLEKLLSSDFANKAPASVVDKEREKLSAFKETAQKLKVQLNR